MSQEPNKFSRFWKELKRRRVVHVITVYCSAAWLIIQLVNNLIEPLHLPPASATITIIVLAVGFPLTVIFSWIYDISGEGIVKTEPLEESKEGQKISVPNAWKIATYVSFVVILGLLTFNIVNSSSLLRAGDIKSLVILPFDNFTGDEDLENVVSGMHALLVGDIGRISEVRVYGKTTSNAYKDVDLTAMEIGTELDVDAALEASIMCLGDSVCMQFRLVRTQGQEELLWVADYKEDKSKIFNLYNQVTKQIADEIKIELTPEEERIFAKSRIADREAIDAYVRSYQYWEELSQESLYKALNYLNAAVEKDHDFAPIHTGLAQVWIGLAQLGFESHEVAGPKIFEHLTKAIELDPDFPDAHYLSAILAVWTEWNWEKGEQAFKKALAVNPNNSMARVHYGHFLMIMKRYEDAIMQAQIAAELDPMNPLVLSLSALVDVQGRLPQALQKSKKALEIDPNHYFGWIAYGEASYFLEDYESSLKANLKTWPGLDDKDREAIWAVFKNDGYVEAVKTYLSIVEEFAISDYLSYIELSEYYWKGGYLEKAIQSVIKGYELHDPNAPYLTQPVSGFNDMKNDPRIIAIVEKMNLPIESLD